MKTPPFMWLLTIVIIVGLFLVGYLIGLKMGVSEGRHEIMSRLSDDVILILELDEAGVLKELETMNNHTGNDVTNLFHFSKIILRKK